MTRKITIEREYPHPRNKVWRALTDSRALAEWLMENDFEPRVGHQFTFRTEPGPGFDGIVHCEVLELEEPSTLVYSWKGGPLDTVVRYSLDETATGTRLRVVHSGFRGLKAELVRLILKAGSKRLYGRALPALLDRLESDGSIAATPPVAPEDCRRGPWRVLAGLFSPILGRKPSS